MVLDDFHPAIAAWFRSAFPAPTQAQELAWPAIRAGRNTLVAAPTGSGKTLTAFLAAIDALVCEGLAQGLRDETAVVYVSPLKALSNDIHLNLEAPLAGIGEALRGMGLDEPGIRTAVRTGDTPASERQSMRRKPPHILVTTPESLYVLMGSESGRAMLSTVRTVIVDEIHAVADDKRGSHLSLTLERLRELCAQPPVRIGLSATQKPIDEVARFLVGADAVDAAGRPDCAIVDIGYAKQRDLALELPGSPLSAVMSHEQWDEVYERLAALVGEHRTTLVFVNTRRMAERAARHLADRLGKDAVAAHHGSLARELRLDAEQRLKRGELRVLVATASLELGIDIGDIDLVCQLGSPRAIAAFLQRVGRAGHHVGGVPKGRLFPQSRDDLVECAALLDSVRRGELDALQIPSAPLDVLAQQIVAEVGSQEWGEDALYACLRCAWPYAGLQRKDFDAVVRMLADGFTTRRGPRSAYIHRDAVHGRLRARRGSRMIAVMSGGTIPDTGDYTVLLEPEAVTIGNVNEDFAIESLAGDVFQLGNASYRILRVEPGRVRVEDAQGQPPNIPFWLGEAPGRSDELSASVSRLREAVENLLAASPQAGEAARSLSEAFGFDAETAIQVVDYLGRTRQALGVVPSQDRLVFERFFDESGGTQLVIHSPYGSRINRAWGLALRKRFCRKFNFELQAAATEDAIVLSLSTSHSFPLEDVARYLHSASALDVLTQALLDAPLFAVRWRWSATTALALPRFVGGRKVAPQLQRMKSEDLLATVFPDQVACAENLVGEREVPDHPLVAQTLHDCLYEAMDSAGWLRMLRRLELGEVQVIGRDVTAPSPIAAEAINARPYAFLDDAPLEERRTQAVMARRYAEADSAGDLGRLDPEAIEAVRGEAWPEVRDADEMHEALMGLGFVTIAEAAANDWPRWLTALADSGRATALRLSASDPAPAWWVATENLPQARALFAEALAEPAVAVPEEYLATAWSGEEALVELLRSRLTALGPTTLAALARDSRRDAGEIELALLRLEQEGYVMRGRFGRDSLLGGDEEWCERHLLARIHRYTVGRLRREIEPVEPRDFARFLFDWQHLTASTRMHGPQALRAVLEQLEGYEAPASVWESELLPARIADYDSSWLDELCSAGRVTWARLRPDANAGAVNGAAAAPVPQGVPSVRQTPIVLLPRRALAEWRLAAGRKADPAPVSSRAQRVLAALEARGASFFDELERDAHLLRTELEEALGELVTRGRITCDSYAGLRALLVPPSKRVSTHGARRRRALLTDLQDAGRWSLTGPAEGEGAPADAARNAEANEHIAWRLLERYGVVFWRLIQREAAWLPPWRDLLRVYRRLEARGEIRGGRFVSGMSGEQFALPDAVNSLRQIRQRGRDGAVVCVSAADPLNLTGSVLAGVKVPRIPGARIAFRDGVAVASLLAGQVEELVELPADIQREVHRLLLRRPGSAAAAAEASIAEVMRNLALR
ncbi:DEAD/DEAH box helicase [Lysobacter antibioticus]|uniref:DEAD/DEAH box helicase family protein n=1 Tax=Lysobacter antibioticus TaxID=84531 RepID=A0A0S2FBQ6_LYSAN|nr:DEAD/DEAH box helicase [Lysobacter antibioticus]ALN80877.1 DEAD/DEAH box helicase family protein [Lysobacter antibioticus]